MFISASAEAVFRFLRRPSLFIKHTREKKKKKKKRKNNLIPYPIWLVSFLISYYVTYYSNLEQITFAEVQEAAASQLYWFLHLYLFIFWEDIDSAACTCPINRGKIFLLDILNCFIFYFLNKIKYVLCLFIFWFNDALLRLRNQMVQVFTIDM